MAIGAAALLSSQLDIRRWRHRMQALLLDYIVEGDVLTQKTVHTGLYVTVPNEEPKSRFSAGSVQYVDLETENAIDGVWYDDEDMP